MSIVCPNCGRRHSTINVPGGCFQIDCPCGATMILEGYEVDRWRVNKNGFNEYNSRPKRERTYGIFNDSHRHQGIYNIRHNDLAAFGFEPDLNIDDESMFGDLVVVRLSNKKSGKNRRRSYGGF